MNIFDFCIINCMRSSRISNPSFSFNIPTVPILRMKDYIYILHWFLPSFVNLNSPISGQCSLSIPPENVWKPNVFWRFQGVYKGSIDLKWVNRFKVSYFFVSLVIMIIRIIRIKISLLKLFWKTAVVSIFVTNWEKLQL